MKKSIIILSAIGVLALSSCIKEKTCTCTTETDGTTVESVAYVKGGDCSDLNSESSYGGVTIKTTCVEE